MSEAPTENHVADCRCGEVGVMFDPRCLELRKAPSSNQDSTEKYYAEMEAARNAAEAAYFDARPLLDREGAPVDTFRAGFERAFKKLWNELRPAADSWESYVAAQERKGQPDETTGNSAVPPWRHVEELRRHAGYIEKQFATTAWVMRRIADEIQHLPVETDGDISIDAVIEQEIHESTDGHDYLKGVHQEGCRKCQQVKASAPPVTTFESDGNGQRCRHCREFHHEHIVQNAHGRSDVCRKQVNGT